MSELEHNKGRLVAAVWRRLVAATRDDKRKSAALRQLGYVTIEAAVRDGVDHFLYKSNANKGD